MPAWRSPSSAKRRGTVAMVQSFGSTVSTPITWDEVDAVEPNDCTMATVPRRFAELGDLHAGIDQAVFAIDQLLSWAARDERAGAVDAGVPDEHE